MARSLFSLAALATAAVPGLNVTQVRPDVRHGDGFDAAVLTTTEGRALVIRVPRDQVAETEQSADLVALRAMTAGVRSRLPFEVPEFLGQAPIDGTRGIVTGHLDGQIAADALLDDPGLADAAGRAIAAIHNLPTGFLSDAGLARPSAADIHQGVLDLINKAAATGHLPAALLRRWERATDDAALWRFNPTVINGDLSAEAFLVSGDSISGVVGWSCLAQGDPARDLHWLLSSRGASAEVAFNSYLGARTEGADPILAQRAMLHGELQLARWLLHGVEHRDQAIIADAVGMLDNLVAHVHAQTSDPLSPETAPITIVADVERMLDATPHDVLHRGGAGDLLTDSFDSVDTGTHASATAVSNETRPIPLDLSGWAARAEDDDAEVIAGEAPVEAHGTASHDQAPSGDEVWADDANSSDADADSTKPASAAASDDRH